MIALSRAIRQGNDPDPLRAACATLKCDFSMASLESAKVMELHALHSAWPQIGQTIRSWPALALQAEKLQIVRTKDRSQPSYRREAHCSLYKLITTLHDRFEWSNTDVADLLESARL